MKEFGAPGATGWRPIVAPFIKTVDVSPAFSAKKPLEFNSSTSTSPYGLKIYYRRISEQWPK
ncbi:MAG: hypothetical protein V4632_09835 [Pseudomonadota bacterium]